MSSVCWWTPKSSPLSSNRWHEDQPVFSAVTLDSKELQRTPLKLFRRPVTLRHRTDDWVPFSAAGRRVALGVGAVRGPRRLHSADLLLGCRGSPRHAVRVLRAGSEHRRWVRR